MPPSTFNELVKLFLDIIGKAIPVIGGIALLLFLWGAAMVIFQGGSEDAVRDGKRRIFWGLIALFVMFSVWGLVSILTETFFNP
ncbi:MAG: hypothetical protein Q8R39_04080 [bacterium]|nr:hypothetical protein [bacterium]MDZ4284245.1 hypothetical protein [Patescibacteria group bacterium]